MLFACFHTVDQYSQPVIQVHSSGMFTFTFKVVLQYLVKNRVIISLMEMAVFAKTIAF